jgi:glucokinase
MALLGIDIGGTKLAAAVFTDEGEIISRDLTLIGDHGGKDAGALVTVTVRKLLNQQQNDGSRIKSIGISVPGIYRINEGTVWAPNISGWDNYPLLREVEAVCETLSSGPDNEGGVHGPIPVTIDSDRACYILGEMWKGNARGCRNAIFLSVGTGIGAGILADGRILRGANDIAGAIGWMALSKPFKDEYVSCGCFEHHASGEGIAKVAREFLKEEKNYSANLKDKPAADFTTYKENPGALREKPDEELTSHDVFAAYRNGDPLAEGVLQQSVEYWGMAVANLISLFNPEKIILGGGVFGPAVSLIPDIIKEASRWAQPISSRLVSIEGSALGGDAGVYGAGWLAKEKLGFRV